MGADCSGLQYQFRRCRPREFPGLCHSGVPLLLVLIHVTFCLFIGKCLSRVPRPSRSWHPKGANRSLLMGRRSLHQRVRGCQVSASAFEWRYRSRKLIRTDTRHHFNARPVHKNHLDTSIKANCSTARTRKTCAKASPSTTGAAT